ncbi:cupin domain-containing protein [Ornithinibacillus sp. L9]|uniref:Cupin domain-containing protein n=1 Tax=Ornithinibacillus caprae TaxID=2678566 RepID=A0A6N8FHI3_9BACI|nr:cupin domain-containing protein [Ornithinibacillus caprae]MUK88905.1 cupin domain-containing protein [Ornithinibacillus caprae]
MQIFNFKQEVGTKITHFDSNFVMSRILNTQGSVHIGCMHLEIDGVIGYHQATVSQLLLIVEGEGEVRGEEDRFIRVTKGDAVFWEAREWHETKTECGLTAIVIEGKNINPTSLMPKKGGGIL